MSRRRWQPWENDILNQYSDVKVIARKTNRSIGSIYARISYLLHRRPKGVFVGSPKPLPIDRLRSGCCPGIGHGHCGKRLWQEVVMSPYGYSTQYIDLVCDAGHRFPLQKEVFK